MKTLGREKAAFTLVEMLVVIVIISLVALAVLALLYVAWRRVLRARLGGYTGDALGAAQQVAELALLLVLAAGA